MTLAYDNCRKSSNRRTFHKISRLRNKSNETSSRANGGGLFTTESPPGNSVGRALTCVLGRASLGGDVFPLT